MLANWLNTQIDIFPHRLHDSWLFLGPCNSIFFFSGNCPPQRSLSCPFLNPFHSKQAECRRCTKRTGVNRRQTPQCSRQRCHFVHFYTKKNKANIFPLFLLRRPAVFILLILYISSLYIFLFAVISLYVLSFFVAANHLTFGRHVRSCKYSNYLSPATPCKPTKKSNQSIANIKTVNHRFSEKQNNQNV